MPEPDETLADVTLRPIGVIRTPHTDPGAAPIQPVFARGIPGRVEVFDEYAEGLRDLEGFSHVHLLYHLHRAPPARLTVKPYLEDVPRGVFATRAPCRPNGIGLSLVRLVAVAGCVLEVEDVDMLDGSPLLDIKPYVTRFDVRDGARCGWQDQVDDDTARRRGRRQSPQP